MVLRKPLVLNNGQTEQLQPGDLLDVDHLDVKNRTNNSGSAIPKATPVYSSSATEIEEAQADAQGTIRVMGLTVEAIADTASGGVGVDGIVTATTGEWDAVTGETGGLTPGANYFLSAASPGMLTQTAPTTPGAFVVRVGYALSATEFEIEIGQPIKL